MEWHGSRGRFAATIVPSLLVTRCMSGRGSMASVLEYTQLSKPQQNGYAEHLNRTVRHECLEMNAFAAIDAA